MIDARSEPTPVQYGPPGSDRPFQRSLATDLPFDTVVETIRSVLRDDDLWIIHEIDPRMLLERGGYAIPRTRQILFFHPRYMVRLLGADPSALPEAPLKVVVMEDENAVRVRWLAPEALFDRYDDDRLAALGCEFGSFYAAIVSRLAETSF